MTAVEERVWTMGDYVDESPVVLRDNLARFEELTDPLMGLCGDRMPKRIRLVASGSSYNACQCAHPFMSACLPGVDVRVVTPHRFSYYESEVDPDELLLVVTQSGLSTNALAALDAIRAQGARAVCLTGDVEADAREHADLMVDWGAGVELVGYVTKGVSTLALFLMMFACRLGGRLDRLPELGRAVDVLDAVRASTYPFFERHEKALTSMRLSYSVAADGARGVALESALKVGETVHVPSPAYEVEEFIHGPNLQLTPGYTLFFYDAPDATRERTRLIYRAAREVSDAAFLLTSAGACDEAPEWLASDANVLVAPELPSPELAAFAYLPFVQLVSHLASSALGSSKQHPLLKRFKAIAAAKTDSFVNYDGDD